MGPGFESQQDHASNLGAGFLRFTKEIPRLFVLIQFIRLTESQVRFISPTAARNPICRRCVSLNYTNFAMFLGHVAPLEADTFEQIPEMVKLSTTVTVVYKARVKPRLGL